MVGYAKAVWRGSPNHYQGRNGYKVTHITLHIMVGSLQGTDTVFQRSSYRASSTYGVGTDGTVYQWVDEINGAWCDANMASDCSGISIEHAGGIAGIAPTDAEYEAPAVTGGRSCGTTRPATAPAISCCTARCPARITPAAPIGP